jgi:3-phosphoshikimate 1-carboxyvinyltransferase
MLLIRHLLRARGIRICLKNVSNCEDTGIIRSGIQAIESNTPTTVDCKNSATAYRFLNALNNSGKGHLTLVMSQRLKERLGNNKMTSQNISAKLLVNMFNDYNKVTVLPTKVSKPYINMTQSLIKWAKEAKNGEEYRIERCWSSAAFAYCLMAVRKCGSVIIPQLKPSLLQGDSIAESLFRNFGVRTEFINRAAVLTFDPSLCVKGDIEIDLASYPDLYLPLAVAASQFRFTTRFINTQAQSYKECDRMIAAEQLKRKPTDSLQIQTFGDHRVAMSFAMLAFRYGNVILDNKNCVRKSFPNFWRNFR